MTIPPAQTYTRDLNRTLNIGSTTNFSDTQMGTVIFDELKATPTPTRFGMDIDISIGINKKILSRYYQNCDGRFNHGFFLRFHLIKAIPIITF